MHLQTVLGSSILAKRQLLFTQHFKLLRRAIAVYSVCGCGPLVCAQSRDAAKEFVAEPESLRSARSAAVADAAEQQDWPAVRRLVAAMPEKNDAVNQAQADGMTALHWAVWHDNLGTTRHLLEAGANVEAANRYGVQPLTLACLNGNEKVARELLMRGANANTQSAGGETALMTAARTGAVGIVKLLLSHEADIQAREHRGQTALMWAAAEGHADVVQALIAAGADCCNSLTSGFTPLLFAAREGRIEVARVLLAAGADVNAVLKRDKGGSGKAPRIGSSPLILAVENGHFELAVFLLESGANPNDQRSGYTALHTLTWVRKPNRGDGDDGDPAPMGSGKLNSLQFVRELHRHGADLNARLEKGSSGRGQLNRTSATPFLLAASTDDLPLMKLLVELGADPHIPNADACTPLMAAAGIGVLAPGEEAGTEEEALAAVEYLIGLGQSVDTVDRNGETAMHGAAYKSLPRMVDFLQSQGADPKIWNVANKYGWTPIDIALGHRPGNFKPSEPTQAALRRALGHP